ncbi:hypothetical protein BASA81_000348 [Batrachochytrium salamandrivorans]|nr:hypothetical protein BASA81_000348 [Batrachochytrium salamandrivorans]
MPSFVKTTLKDLKGIATSGDGYYVGGTHGTVEDRIGGHDKVTIGTVYYAPTSDVKYDENLLLSTDSAKKNSHDVSNCKSKPGFVYVACKSAQN